MRNRLCLASVLLFPVMQNMCACQWRADRWGVNVSPFRLRSRSSLRLSGPDPVFTLRLMSHSILAQHYQHQVSSHAAFVRAAESAEILSAVDVYEEFFSLVSVNTVFLLAVKLLLCCRLFVMDFTVRPETSVTSLRLDCTF